MMIKKKRLYFLLFFCGITHAKSDPFKVYHYYIEAGSPANYPMIYDFTGNYFFDKDLRVFLNFTAPGGSAMYWGGGTQATSISEYNPLPYGMNIRWFSVTENQFWEGSYLFDQKILQKFPNYTVNNILFRDKTPFTRYFSFNVYVTPGGLVTIWVNAEGEQFLVGQFYAEKMQTEPDWNLFYRRAISKISRIIEPRISFIEDTIQRSKSYIKDVYKGKPERFNTHQTKKPYTAEPWLKTMKKYHWYLSLNEGFALKDYLTWYVNGEKIFTYTGDNQLATTRAVPYNFTFYFTDTLNNNKLKRIDITFDSDEIMEIFQKVSRNSSTDPTINLYIEIDHDYKQVSVFVINGKTKIELKKIHRATLSKLYNA